MVRPGTYSAVVGIGCCVALATGCGDDAGLSADAGADTSVVVGTAPTFDGCGSSGDIANYRWIIRETPSDMADDVDKAIREEATDCSFELESSMVVDEVGVWTVELIVSDADGNTSSDRVDITVEP